MKTVRGIRMRRLQVTYEELKLSQQADHVLINASLQVTYEELKLMHLCNAVNPFQGLQVTYEELKHYQEGETIKEPAGRLQVTYEELKRTRYDWVQNGYETFVGYL